MATKQKEKFENAKKAFKDLGIAPSLGEVIRSLRECDEILQIDLAKQLNVSRQFLSDVEHDRKIVGVEFAKKLSKSMGYPIEMFLQAIIDAQLKRAGIKCNVQISSVAS